MKPSSKPVVTAVGRLLSPKNHERHICHIIKVKPDGTVKTVLKEEYF